MISISFLDLLPASMAAVGFWRANAWFYAGVGFFALIVYFIPEPASADQVIAASDKSADDRGTTSSAEDRKHRKEVLMSGIITAIGTPFSLHPACCATRPLALVSATATGGSWYLQTQFPTRTPC